MADDIINLQELNLKLGRAGNDTRLDAVPRAMGWIAGLGTDCPMFGHDLWNAYEVGFLLPGGKPAVFHMQISYDAASPNIVESKSLKLFLHACSTRTFVHVDDFADVVRTALSATVGAPVTLVFYQVGTSPAAEPLPGIPLDELSPRAMPARPDGSVLESRELPKPEPFSYHTHLFRSNCPVTGQPDWAAVLVEGLGGWAPLPQNLLAYLLSFRDHRAFHETCCERIYQDLFQALTPDRLRVSCFFTRRGGLDINPDRGNFELAVRRAPVWRQ